MKKTTTSKALALFLAIATLISITSLGLFQSSAAVSDQFSSSNIMVNQSVNFVISADPTNLINYEVHIYKDGDSSIRNTSNYYCPSLPMYYVLTEPGNYTAYFVIRRSGSSDKILSTSFVVTSDFQLTSNYPYQAQGSSDCKATAVANALKILSGKNYSLSGENSLAKVNNAISNMGDSVRIWVTNHDADQENLAYNNPTRQMNAINSELDARHPIVVEVKGSSTQHWVTVIGRSGSNYIIVNPAGAKIETKAASYFGGSNLRYYGIYTFGKA